MQDTIRSYDAIAAAYAERWFDTRLTSSMSRFADRLGRGVRVLDVGCGPGRDVAWLAEQGFQAVGIDLSQKMLEKGSERDIPAPLIQADMQQLPFRKGSFKGLWVCASLLHIPKDQVPHVLRELERVVHPGHIYLAVKRGEGQEYVEDPVGHRRLFVYYHPAEIQLLMERAGFEVLDCWENQDQAGRSRSWINVLAWSKIQTPRSGASVLICNDEGDVLLTQRADNGKWCLPGGHLDFGETVEQCAVREAYEETGLVVEIERLVGVYSAPFATTPDLPNPRHYVILCFQCHQVGGALQISDETIDIRYFSPHHLPADLWPWHRLRIQDALANQNTPFIR